MKTVVVKSIRIYQLLLSPYCGCCCRFYPCCSEYAIQAVAAFGVVKGLRLALMRLCRCHPLSSGGYDPIPNGDETRR